MTRLERIRKRLSYKVDPHYKEDVAWLVETVDILAKRLKRWHFGKTIPRLEHYHEHCQTCVDLARLEEPDA